MRGYGKIFICFLLFGCQHPESQTYARNQGSRAQPENAKEDFRESITANVESIATKDVNESANILKMENENGVRYVWIEINGIRLRFIFDTGASSVCISPAEATVLYRQGTLRREDIIDVEYFQDATGRISEGTKVNLRSIKIGNRVLENVEATIVDNINAPLLLGQTLLKRFGKIEINNEKDEIILK